MDSYSAFQSRYRHCTFILHPNCSKYCNEAGSEDVVLLASLFRIVLCHELQLLLLAQGAKPLVIAGEGIVVYVVCEIDQNHLRLFHGMFQLLQLRPQLLKDNLEELV